MYTYEQARQPQAATWWHSADTSEQPPLTPGRQPPKVTFQDLAPGLRRQIMNRIYFANLMLAQHAWQRRNGRAMSPHGVMFLYAEPYDGDPPASQLRTSTRLFLAQDEPYLPTLLARMAKDAVALGGKPTRDAVGQLVRDPREECLSTRRDRMSADAWYIGVGAFTLERNPNAWQEAQDNGIIETSAGARCCVRLTDSSQILIDRAGASGPGDIRVWTTHEVERPPLRGSAIIRPFEPGDLGMLDPRVECIDDLYSKEFDEQQTEFKRGLFESVWKDPYNHAVWEGIDRLHQAILPPLPSERAAGPT